MIAAAADKPTSTILNKFLEIVHEVTPKMLYEGVQVAAKAGLMENMNVLLKIIDDKDLGDKASLIEELSQDMIERRRQKKSFEPVQVFNPSVQVF